MLKDSQKDKKLKGYGILCILFFQSYFIKTRKRLLYGDSREYIINIELFPQLRGGGFDTAIDS